MAQYGYRRDADTGLYYCRARWYDPDAGQFLSPDPLNSLQTGRPNAYLYAGGNPVAHIDPEGRDYIASTQASQFGVRRDRVLWHVQQRNVTGRDRFTATIPVGDFSFGFERVRLDPRFGGKLLNYYDIQDIAEGINGDLIGQLPQTGLIAAHNRFSEKNLLAKSDYGFIVHRSGGGFPDRGC